MIDWYYKEGDNKIGPITDEQIKELAGQGKISAETLVWNEFIGSWRTYGSVSGASAETSSVETANSVAPIASAGASFGQTADTHQSDTWSSAESYAPPKESYCSQCFKKFPDEDLINYGDMKICAECKALFFQKLREGSNVSGALNYAGFWIRFVAKFIDGVIESIVGMIFMAVMVPVIFPVIGNDPRTINISLFMTLYAILVALNISFDIAYKTFFVGKFGATPGKMALGLKVVTPDGGQVSYMRAFGRYFGEMISGMILLIGYIMAAFDDEKRALHDRICGTRVIRK
jgi:uncharacterized RDD family membrane protein YckC